MLSVELCNLARTILRIRARGAAGDGGACIGRRDGKILFGFHVPAHPMRLDETRAHGLFDEWRDRAGGQARVVRGRGGIAQIVGIAGSQGWAIGPGVDDQGRPPRMRGRGRVPRLIPAMGMQAGIEVLL